MTSDKKEFSTGNYIEVKDRLPEFYAAYPEGRLQSEIVHWDDKRVIVKALAYRTPDDPLPAIGHSWIEVPGRTPFTRGSELENCETSAWGRALAALGIAVNLGIATGDEIRSKQGGREELTWEGLLNWAQDEHGLSLSQVLEILKIDEEVARRLGNGPQGQGNLRRASVAIENAIQGNPPAEPTEPPELPQNAS